MSQQRIIIVEGPDRCGKTNIGQALASEIHIPYFKMTTEYDNWRKKDGFLNALRFDQTYIAQFLKQTGHSVVMDRNYASEFAYSDVFKRETDPKVLLDVDREFAKMGAIYVLCLRRDYGKTQEDDLVPREKLAALHNKYVEFSLWTMCKTLPIYVDDFDNDLSRQLPYLMSRLDEAGVVDE